MHKFSKVPLQVTRKRMASGSVIRSDSSSKETTFVYLPVTPDAGLLARITAILDGVSSSLDGHTEQHLPLLNLSVNELTGGASVLHVSLCHNMTLSRPDLDAFIEHVRHDSTLAGIRFPLELRFQSDVHLLYNNDRSRCFVALRLTPACVAAVRPLVELLNAYSGTPYDPALLHVSVGVLSPPNGSSLPGTLKLPASSRLDSIRIDSAELTRGRSVVTLLPRPASASQDGQAAGGKGERADRKASKKRGREGAGGGGGGGLKREKARCKDT